MPSPPTPTAAELAVLQVLWRRGPSTVRAVHEDLEAARAPDARAVGYTTTLKTMQVMLERGHVTRDASGRSHVYAAAVAQEATQDTLLDRFLDRAFAGSASALAMRALGKRTPSPAEIAELRAFLDTLAPDTPPQDD